MHPRIIFIPSGLNPLRKAPPERGFNFTRACWRHSPRSLNVELGVRFDGTVTSGEIFCAGHGSLVFRQARKMGLEGIVSKRLGSRYRSGRSPDSLKFKNPAAPAVRREAEEDWGRVR